MRSRPPPRASATCGSPRWSGRTSRSRTARSSSIACGSPSRSSTSRASSSVPGYVFGYGSLAGALEHGGSIARLRGYRRRWAVAMDNRVDLPGYKYYVDAQSGERPAVYVAYLDLEPDPDNTVNGVAFEATDVELRSLDARERNYERRVVKDEPRTYA